ncbi:MAG: hypothetical protein AAB461_00410 [Patescibacteria group bacterium]
MNIKNLQTAFGKVFANANYIILAGALAVGAFVFAVWLPNFGLIGDVFSSSSVPLAAKIKIAVSLLGGISTNFSFLSAGYTIAIAALFGVNMAMVIFFLKQSRMRLAGQDVATGFGGIASGILGIGCASCGSFILSAALSSFGAAGALAILPLKGGEFGILSIILLLFSLTAISKRIAAPLVCKSSNN